MKGMGILFAVMLLGILVATLWTNIPVIKTTVHSALDPSLGALLNWNLNLGFLIIAAFFTLITTLVQKYLTDQAALKELKHEQKILQEEMKKYKEHPEKLMELQKKSMEIVAKTFPLTSRPLLFTAIPFILFIRWFGDYFTANPVKILYMNWLFAYILFSIIFSMIFRKIFDVH